jgi:hypothetical protein
MSSISKAAPRRQPDVGDTAVARLANSALTPNLDGPAEVVTAELSGAPSRRRRPEQQLQRAVLQHLELRSAPNVYWFHVGNGGWRTPIEAKVFKSLGVKPGVPDLILIRGGKTYGLELKADKGRLTPVQATAHVLMRAAGAEVEVAVGIDAALRTLEAWRLLKGRAA